jgi:hypothetical protein
LTTPTPLLETEPAIESLIAMYWDHIRSLPRLAVFCLGNFTKKQAADLETRSWDELLEDEQKQLRRAIFELSDFHDHTRQVAKARRELQGKPL